MAHGASLGALPRRRAPALAFGMELMAAPQPPQGLAKDERLKTDRARCEGLIRHHRCARGRTSAPLPFQGRLTVAVDVWRQALDPCLRTRWRRLGHWRGSRNGRGSGRHGYQHSALLPVPLLALRIPPSVEVGLLRLMDLLDHWRQVALGFWDCDVRVVYHRIRVKRRGQVREAWH